MKKILIVLMCISFFCSLKIDLHAAATETDGDTSFYYAANSGACSYVDCCWREGYYCKFGTLFCLSAASYTSVVCYYVFTNNYPVTFNLLLTTCVGPASCCSAACGTLACLCVSETLMSGKFEMSQMPLGLAQLLETPPGFGLQERRNYIESLTHDPLSYTYQPVEGHVEFDDDAGEWISFCTPSGSAAPEVSGTMMPLHALLLFSSDTEIFAHVLQHVLDTKENMRFQEKCDLPKHLLERVKAQNCCSQCCVGCDACMSCNWCNNINDTMLSLSPLQLAEYLGKARHRELLKRALKMESVYPGVFEYSDGPASKSSWRRRKRYGKSSKPPLLDVEQVSIELT